MLLSFIIYIRYLNLSFGQIDDANFKYLKISYLANHLILYGIYCAESPRYLFTTTGIDNYIKR